MGFSKFTKGSFLTKTQIKTCNIHFPIFQIRSRHLPMVKHENGFIVLEH